MSKNQLSVPAAAIAMVTSMLGGGVLFLPSAFGVLGFVNGFLVLFLCSISCFYTLYCISYCAHHHRQSLIKSTTDKSQNNSSKNKISKSQEAISVNGNPSNAQPRSASTSSDSEVMDNARTDSQRSSTNIDNPRSRVDIAKIDSGLSYYSVTARRSAILAVAVDCCIVLQGCGSCICYIQTLVSWIATLFGVRWPTYAVAFGCTAPLFGLALLPNLSSLRHASLLSVSAVAFLAILLVIYAVSLGITSKDTLQGTTLEAASRMLFALGAHQNAVQVFSELKVKDIGAMGIAGATAYATGALLYGAIGACGYKVAGIAANRDILNALLDPKTPVSIAIQKRDTYLVAPKLASILFFGTLGCAFPMQMHPTRNSLVNIFALTRMKSYIDKNTQKARTITTCLLTALVLGIACVPGLDPARVVSFIGATATVGITFVFPAILHAQCIGKVTLMSMTSSLVAILGVILSIALVSMQLTVGVS